MKLSIQEGSLNYAAQIIEIAVVQPIEGKDRIQTTVVNGSTVIISKEMKVGQKCVYFVSGSCLSDTFCRENNLYDQPHLNADTSKKGYLSHKRRVRPLKLGATISDGMIMPVETLGNYPLSVGDTFTHIDGTLICEKYFVPVRSGTGSGAPPKQEKHRLTDILIPGQLRFHFETPHIGRNMDKLKGEVIVTFKVHGSSCILSRVKVLRKLTLIDRIARLFGGKIVTQEYADIYSSGKPRSSTPKGIVSKWTNTGKDFYESNIWKQAYDDYKYVLEDGITLYGELVGNHIQKGYDYTRLCEEERQYGFLIYRITRTTDSGIVDEFSWDQILQYCQKYGIKTVPFLSRYSAEEYGAQEAIEMISKAHLEKPDIFCINDVPAEGVCLRIGNEIFKLKSKNFLLSEDKQLEAEIPNTEDI